MFGGSISACRGVFFGGPRVKRVRLDIARTADDVVFTADDLFGAIACSVYVSEQGRRDAPEVVPGNAPAGPRSVRLVWRAHCPSGNDCARAVRYGDARFQSDLPPAPLGSSQPGECYLCSVSGDRRRGEVLFSIGANGEIADCAGSKR